MLYPKWASATDMQSEIRRRYELKMVAQGTQAPLVRSWVRSHRSGFVASYPTRRVNNVYLDTPDLQWLGDNIDGISGRRKVMFRWYGDEVSQIEGVVEVKRKQNLMSWKVSCPLSHRFDFEDRRRWADFVAVLSAELPVRMKAEIAGGWWPVLLNRYSREYFVTLDGKVRVTIDCAQELYDQRSSAYPNLTRRVPYPDTVVVEVKGSVGSWEHVKEVCSNFPLSVTKNSKYAVGCEAILNY